VRGEAMDKRIVVYGTQTCPYCVQLKEFLKNNGVDFEDIDISVDPEKGQEVAEKTGQIGIPVIDIDGRFIVGFDQKTIKEALGL